MTKVYRHTTPEMLARVIEAVERLAIARDMARIWLGDGQSVTARWGRICEMAKICGNEWCGSADQDPALRHQ
jgi:hypothetical protein